MAGINRKVFGSDIDVAVKKKLEARQLAAGGEINPTDPITSKYKDNRKKDGADGKGSYSTEELLSINFKNGEADLSSRTPFVRMWTALEIRKLEKDGDVVENMTPEEQQEIKNDPSKTFTKVDGGIQKKNIVSYERIIYQVNNHILNELSDPLQQRVGNEREDTSIASSDVIPNIFETNKNQYLKPPAGITNVTSNTEGSLGSIKKTTINFIIHNFHDYDKIYSRYFLRPGAQIFVDFGWDSISELYKPENLFNNKKLGRGETVEEKLFGNNGYVTQARGDLETIIGLVSDFDSKIKENGSIECVLTLISKNTSLITSEIDDAVKSKLLFALDTEVTKHAIQYFLIDEEDNKVAEELEKELRTGKSLSAKEQAVFNQKSQAFLAANLANDKGNFPIEKNVLSGVYWQSIQSRRSYRKNYRDQSTIKEFPGSTKNIYISFGLLEDAIFNSEFGIGENFLNILGSNKEFGNFEARFDSSNTYVKFDPNLLNRQEMITDATKLSFLYPNDWTETYNTILKKVPDIRYDENNPQTVYGEKQKRIIPLRELFIQLTLIKTAFEAKNVEDAIETILKTINEDSYDIFNLQLSSGDTINSKINIVDNNFINIGDKTDNDFFDGLFMFKPMSNNSIVKSFDFSISTPKGDLQSMIAIQSLPTGKNLFPLSSVVDTYLSLNSTNQQEARRDSDGSDTGVVYLPVLGSFQTDKLDEDLNLESSLANHFKKIDFTKTDNDSNTLLDRLSQVFTNTNQPQYNDIKKVTSENQIDTQKYEAVNDDAQIASNISDYFALLAKNTYVDEIPTILPANLSLSIYGISTLSPGDVFRVDYLPERYRELVYFQIINVTQNINSSTWTTQLDTVMRIRKQKKKQTGLWREKTNVYLSKTFFDKIQLLGNFSKVKNKMREIKVLPVKNRTSVKYIFGFKAQENKSYEDNEGILINIDFPTVEREPGDNVRKYMVRGNNLPSKYSFKKDDFNLRSVKNHITKKSSFINERVANTTGGLIYRVRYDLKLEKDLEYRVIVAYSNMFVILPKGDNDYEHDIATIDELFRRYESFLLFQDKGIDNNFDQIQNETPDKFGPQPSDNVY